MIPLVSVLDFETLSTEHNAALLSIGAVIRDFNTGAQVDTFYANIIPQTSIDAGLHVSESTKAWWAKQGSAAQDVLSVDQRPLRDVVSEFAAWLKKHGVEYAIGNGPRADNQWLESACKALGMQSPVKYWGDLDMRTLTFIGTHILRLPHWHSTFKGVKHNALHDAINEAEFCNNVIQQLINRKPKEMAEYTLSVKTESTAELAEIVAKLNGSEPIQQAVVRAANTIAHDDKVKQVIAQNAPTPIPASPAPEPEDDEGEQNNAAPNVDKNNLPWDARIHAGTKALNADGTWKKRRGVDDATIAAVTAELTTVAPEATQQETPKPSAPVAETPAPTPVPQLETPQPVPTPAPVSPAADVKQPIQQFQEIVQTIGDAGRAASADYMAKYHGPLVQFLLKKSGVTQVPAATAEQMKSMYDVRDAVIANMASITAGVPVETLV